MAKVMTINSGSSSLKFKLYEMPEEKVLSAGNCERIGLEDGIFTIKYDGKKEQTTPVFPNHAVAAKTVVDALVEKGIIKSFDEIEAAGHRIVQGGKYFKGSCLVDEWVKERITELIDLAPLHNGPHIIGIKAFEEALPSVKQTVVFDTAFHQSMDPESFMYAVPYEWYEKYGIRKYGAHGTSHQYVSQEYARLTGKDIKNLKIVTCHIGNGASLCAVEGGKCKDTSMGLTPLEGIPMGTRSGNIDPTVVSYICQKENKDAWTVVQELNKKTG